MTSETRLASLALLLGLTGCSAEFHAKKGREALDQHDLASAEKHFRSALDKEPALADALSGLGWTYQIAGKSDAASAAFDHCLEALPQEVSCMRGKASVLMGKGQAAAAGALLATASGLAPDDPGVQSSQAILDMTLGNMEGAIARYKALIERFPTMAEYRVGYAEVLLRQKKTDEALTVVDEALQFEDTPLRFQAMLHMLRARTLVAATAGRVNPRDCAGTAPPVLAWLDAADASLKQADATGVSQSSVAGVQRLIARRRGAVEDRCPGLQGAAGAQATGADALPTLAAPPARPGAAAPDAADPADEADPEANNAPAPGAAPAEGAPPQ